MYMLSLKFDYCSPSLLYPSLPLFKGYLLCTVYDVLLHEAPLQLGATRNVTITLCRQQASQPYSPARLHEGSARTKSGSLQTRSRKRKHAWLLRSCCLGKVGASIHLSNRELNSVQRTCLVQVYQNSDHHILPVLLDSPFEANRVSDSIIVTSNCDKKRLNPRSLPATFTHKTSVL